MKVYPQNYENILTKIYGDCPNLKILGFFFEHPFREFRIEYISKRLGINHDVVKAYVEYYEEKEYVRDTGAGYALNNKNRMVEAIEDATRLMGDVIFESDTTPPNDITPDKEEEE